MSRDSLGANADRAADRIVRSWLHEDRNVDATRVLGSALAEVDTTLQRRAGWLAWRSAFMGNTVRIAFAAAAVVVIAVIAFNLLPGSQPPGDEPSVSPSVEPSAEPSTAGDLPEGPHVLSDGQLEEGRETVPMTVTIPAPGWYGDVDGEMLEKGTNGAHAPDGARMIVWAPVCCDGLYVYGDACQWVTTRPDEPARTVDAVMTALAAQQSRDASAPVDITLDGYAGKSITLQIPVDADVSQCDNGTFSAWGLSGPIDPGRIRYDEEPGQIDDVWILDVDGKLVVIARATYEGTPQADVDELEAIVESTIFE